MQTICVPLLHDNQPGATGLLVHVLGPTGAVVGRVVDTGDHDPGRRRARSSRDEEVSGPRADGKYEEGERVTYTIVVTNSGLGAQADNAGHEVTDTLPSGLMPVPATSTTGVVGTSGNTVTWDGADPGGRLGHDHDHRRRSGRGRKARRSRTRRRCSTTARGRGTNDGTLTQRGVLHGGEALPAVGAVAGRRSGGCRVELRGRSTAGRHAVRTSSRARW